VESNNLVFAILVAMRQVTLCFLLTDDEILLAMKKRGFGEGKWNGVGGKVDAGESLVDAAVRELHEEVGVRAHHNDLEEVADIRFFFKNKPEWDQHMFIYFIRRWNGEPVESEEVAPLWYKHTDLPYESMWVDDPHWLPRALTGELLSGICHLSTDGTEIEQFDLTNR
jgi:mutator protein MutT